MIQTEKAMLQELCLKMMIVLLFLSLVPSLVATQPVAFMRGGGDAKALRAASSSTNGHGRRRLSLAQDISYPPFAQLGLLSENHGLAGFAPEFAMGMVDVCDSIDGVELIQTSWSQCWEDVTIGEGLDRGEFDACSSYTHAAGVRNQYLEFSNPILSQNKAAGILTRLDEDGMPVVDGLSSLDGVRVVDVLGFAPTADNLALVTNSCTGEKFSGYEIVPPTNTSDFPNDDALKTLLDGGADAMWVYADQVERLQCAHNDEETAWDCTLWDGLGTKFAYIHMGMFDWALAGTTLTIAKKGSGVAELVNPCIDAFLQTEAYFDLCEKHGLTSSCFPNDFFPRRSRQAAPAYNTLSIDTTTECQTGYCSCPPR